MPSRTRWTALLGGLLAAVLLAAPAAAEDKIKVILIDGQNNHNWRATTPLLKQVLEDCGRFTVDVSSHLKPNDKPGTVPTVPSRPT
jgi:hypothetical protein